MIYVFTGEPLQVERAVAKFCKDQSAPFIQEQFDGRELTAARFIEACRTVPLFASRRLVFVKGADQIRKEELEKIERSLAELASLTDIIWIAEKLDRRLRFWLKVQEIGKWQEFRPLNLRDTPRWIIEECRLKGRKIDPEAVDWLVDQLGSDLGLISASLEKALLLGQAGTINVSLLEATVGSANKTIFELTDAIGRRETAKALRMLQLLAENPVGIVAMIARHFRILFKVKETGTGAPPYFLKNYQEQAAKFKTNALRKAVQQIFQTDWGLKSSPLPQHLLLEKLIWELTYKD